MLALLFLQLALAKDAAVNVEFRADPFRSREWIEEEARTRLLDAAKLQGFRNIRDVYVQADRGVVMTLVVRAKATGVK